MNRSLLTVMGIGLIVAGGFWLQLRSRSAPIELDMPPQQFAELPPPSFAADDWPWWRGPNRDNHCPDKQGPQSWSETRNIVWKAPVTGRGHSSPILVGPHVVLTSADEAAQRQLVVCFDRQSGERLWKTTIHEGNFPPKHLENSHASGTPATDGERIFAVFPNGNSMHVTALNREGQILWTKEAGPHGGDGCHGSGTSLAIWESLLFVSDDSPGKGWIAALNRQNGEFAWRKERKTGLSSYGSPIIGNLDGEPRLILAGCGKVTAYDPKSGEVLWERAGLAEAIGNTATIADSMIFASSGYPQRKLLALRADGSVAWKKESGNEIPYPPSMVVHNGSLFLVSDQGFASCFDMKTGKSRWKERLGGSYYSSPLVVGNQIYACSRDGMTTIFEADSRNFTVVARNKLDAPINASPVVVGGRLYIRTESHLYCIGSN